MVGGLIVYRLASGNCDLRSRMQGLRLEVRGWSFEV